MGAIDQTLEARILELGTPVIETAQKYERTKVQAKIHELMDQCIADPTTKTSLLRFIDVLPSLQTSEQIRKHLKQYLWDNNVELPFEGFVRTGARLAGPVLDKIVSFLSKQMAAQFIIGTNVRKAFKNMEGVNAAPFTIDFLGEKTLTNDDADRYIARYVDALDFLPGKFTTNPTDVWGQPRTNLSYKMSAIDPRFNPIHPDVTFSSVCERLLPVYEKAATIGAAFNADIEHRQYRDLIYDTVKKILQKEQLRNYSHAGVVLQAYLKDSEQYLRDWIDFAKQRGCPITIRLTKGCYWDHEVALAQINGWDTPVFTDKKETDKNFEKLTRILLDNNEHVRAAIASHNPRSIFHAIAYAETLSLKQGYEIQLLHGMGEELHFALDQHDIPFRRYRPVGNLISGMGYLVRRLLENTASGSIWEEIDKGKSAQDLLINPAIKVKEDKPIRIITTDFNRQRVSIEKPSFSIEFAEPPPSDFVNLSAADWSEEQTRKNMQQGYEEVQAKMGSYHVDLRIGGKNVSTKQQIESVNPSDISTLVGTSAKAEPKHIDQAIKAAEKAKTQWVRTPAKERAGYLKRAANIMEGRLWSLSALVSIEAGKTPDQAYADVEEAIDFLRFYASEMERIGVPVRTEDLLSELNWSTFRPRGKAAVIAPWNFPAAILTGMASAAIVTGNTVLLKPSSQTPIIAGEIYNMFEEAGLPPGVLNLVPGSGSEIGNHLVDHDINTILFTGSYDVGKGILDRMPNILPGQNYLKMAFVEMGGKNTIIVDKTADPDVAIPAILYSAFGYQGQKCSANSVLAVPRSIYKEFVDKLCDAAACLRMGSATDFATDVGPIIDEVAYNNIKEYIEIGKKEGKIRLGGNCEVNNGYFVHPTIIEANRNSRVSMEEIFGPVLTVVPVKDYKDGLAVMNSRNYALTGGLMSRTPDNIIDFLTGAAHPGNIYVNRSIVGAIVRRQPFGGWKFSGLGTAQAGGPFYLPNLMMDQTCVLNRTRSGHFPGMNAYINSIKRQSA